jgi:hypothetical protein
MRAHRDKSPATYRLVIDNGECSDSCHTDVLASLGGHCPISPLLQKQRKDEQGLWQLKAYAAAAKSCLKGCRQKYFLAPAGPGSPTRASRGGWKSARSCSQQARFWLAGTQCSGAREKRCGEFISSRVPGFLCVPSCPLWLWVFRAQLPIEEFCRGLVSLHPCAPEQEIMDLVGKDDLLDVNVLPAQALNQVSGL